MNFEENRKAYSNRCIVNPRRLYNKEASALDKDSFMDEFLNYFPEYKVDVEQHLIDYEELLLHVFIGATLNEKMIVLLNDEIKYKSDLKKMFQLLEDMASKGNSDIKELLSLTILERLGDDKILLKKSYKYMGEKTKEASCSIESFWGRL